VREVCLLGPASPQALSHLLSPAARQEATGLLGYVGRPVEALAAALVASGVRVTLLTLASEVEQTLTLHGPNLTIHVAHRRPDYRARARDTFSAETEALGHLLSLVDAPLLHAHWTYEFALAAIVAGRPTLVTAHDAPVTISRQNGGRYWRKRLSLARRVAESLQNVIFVSPYLRQQWHREMKLSTTREFVIPNVVDAGQVLRMGSPRRPVILGFGDASRLKNVQGYLDVIELLGPNRDVTARLIAPSLPRHLHRRAAALGVEVVDHLPHAEARAEIAQASLLLHMSREESFGLTIAEAMTLGTPVIAGAQSGATGWLLDSGAGGTLVDVEKPRQVASAVREALARPETLMQMVGWSRARAKAHFGAEAVVAAHMVAYDMVGSRS
jgi:glycosyltransferase involved in cell wall biosynthesis